ncbi:metal-dependent hydrolase [Methanogenium cariaci]|jgi:L-ascorbate metabolism protein UlaG (beta-lactamase superfamily)
MKITWFGHSCFVLDGSKRVVIDPFVPEGKVPEDVDIVAVTHGHGDHFGDTLSFSSAPVVAVNEIARWLQSKGMTAEGMNIGGTIEVEGVRFTMTPALHSSWLEASEEHGFYGGVAAGFVIRMDGHVIYHAGDTGLFSDMNLIRELYHPDIAILPIGGRFTMGPDEALMAAEFVGAGTVIPMHYNTFPPIEQDADRFKKMLERTTDIRVQILSPGETIEI